MPHARPEKRSAVVSLRHVAKGLVAALTFLPFEMDATASAVRTPSQLLRHAIVGEIVLTAGRFLCRVTAVGGE